VDSLDIVAGHLLELELAQSAFNAARGAGQVLSREDREAYEWTVHTSYQYYGISRGEQESRELIRRFTDAARRQGESARGRAR